MSIICTKLGCVAILIITSLSSPITLTWVLSSCMTCLSLLIGKTSSFLQMTKGITLEDAPKSTKQLWRFPLKTSNVKRKGGTKGFSLLSPEHVVSLQFWLYFCLYHVKYTSIFISSIISFWPYHDTFDILLQLNGAIQGILMIQVIFNVFWYFKTNVDTNVAWVRYCSFETKLTSTRYQFALSGDTKEAAEDLHDMDRVDWQFDSYDRLSHNSICWLRVRL